MSNNYSRWGNSLFCCGGLLFFPPIFF